MCWNRLMSDTELPAIPSGNRREVASWVARHLGHLCCDEPRPSPAFVGGQSHADAALAALDVAGYARTRSVVDPRQGRGASKMSPYIRHGLLTLGEVWEVTEHAPPKDRSRYHDELLWQEYARHWYANYGSATGSPIAFEPPRTATPWEGERWPSAMRCVAENIQELHTDGWCVNQARMWLASQYALRAGGDPFVGEHHLFQHLLDGSRAANRLGWQWVAGTSRTMAYSFTRQQVLRQAPRFCEECELLADCPIADLPDLGDLEARQPLDRPPLRSPTAAYGPDEPVVASNDPDVVWLTAESLGLRDPALSAHPDLPAVFVFDEPLLRRLQLSGKRLIFLAETLAEVADNRQLDVHLGSPARVVADTRAAVTFAPVPGFERLAADLDLELHPWPWLRPPTPALIDYLSNHGRVPSYHKFSDLIE